MLVTYNGFVESYVFSRCTLYKENGSTAHGRDAQTFFSYLHARTSVSSMQLASDSILRLIRNEVAANLYSILGERPGLWL